MQPAIEIFFRLGASLRFCSHHDMMRTFKWALIRAMVPVRFSKGYNPQPKISLPVPRSVGMACQCDCLRVYLDHAVKPVEVADRLDCQLPQGLKVLSVRPHTGQHWPQPVAMTCQVDLAAQLLGALEEQIARLMANPQEVFVRRKTKSGQTKTIMVHETLEAIQLEGNQLQFKLRIDPQGNLRPAEVLELLGLPEWLAYQLVRTEIKWSEAPEVADVGPETNEQ